jgi:hypothetical protein
MSKYVVQEGVMIKVNEDASSEKEKIVNYLVKGGFNEKDAIAMVNKHYDYVLRTYGKIPVSKQSDIISTLGRYDK